MLSYAGIDVAFAKGKHLPVLVVRVVDGVVEPLPVRLLQRRAARVPLLADPDLAVSREDLRAAARPHRLAAGGAGAVRRGDCLDARGEASGAIRERVDAARLLQRERFRRSSAQSNAEMSSRQLRRHCELDPPSRSLIEQAITRLGLSARAYDRVLKVARTIADLAATEHIDSAHAEAVHYRALDRGFFRSA